MFRLILALQGCRSRTNLRISRTGSLKHAFIFFQKGEITHGSVVKRVKARMCFSAKGEITQRFIIERVCFSFVCFCFFSKLENETKNLQLLIIPSPYKVDSRDPLISANHNSASFEKPVFQPITKPLSPVIVASMLAIWLPQMSSVRS